MKTYATIKEKWKLCTLACILGCIILFSSLSYNQNHTNLTMLQSIETSSDYSFSHKENTENVSSFQEKLIPGPSLVKFPLPNTKVSIDDLNVTEKEECNIFDGKWVYSPDSNPLYNALQCSFLSEQVTCQNNGRPDFDYEHWSWEANEGCEIPRFNGKDMLERLRGKRLIIVGDSLNRNQWESIACLLYSALPPSRTYVDVKSTLYKVFRAEDYKCSVEFHWSPFLVQLEDNKEKRRAILRLDEIDPSAKKWEGADIMVFNSGHWWMHSGKIKSWDVFEYDGKLVENMEIQSAFEMAMKTWADWIDTKVDSRKTRVFFRSISAAHFGKRICFGRVDPLKGEEYSRVKVPKLIGETIQQTIGSMKTQVRYLDITKLTQFRVDAHPGVFAMKEGQVHPDCSHWCLPGVPDTWNRLLYASMVLDESSIDDQNTTNLAVLKETETPETSNDHISKPDEQVSQPFNNIPDPKAQETKVSETSKDHTSMTDEQVSRPFIDIPDSKAKEIQVSDTSKGHISKPDVQVSQPSNHVHDSQATEEEEEDECDIFEGKWVYKPKSGPPYTESECPFVNEKFSCQENGRPDFDYVNWSWEATGCQIPKFNGTDMLERLRGKRMILVGDSINRNQWESLACLLYSALPPSENKARARAAHHIFRAVDYDFSLEFYWSPFLVQLEESNANSSKILRLDTISSTAQHWLGADILVFNTGHWWMIGGRFQRWDVYQYREKIIEKMAKESAFKVAIKTWARWIDTNVDSTKTRVFFRSYSPTHSGKQTCYGRSKPLMGDEYLYSSYPKAIFETVEKTMRGMETPVEYLNITKLTQYRADAHPGFYLEKQDSSLMRSKKHKNGDCSHWCLPGLPDTWNRLFYASLVRPRRSSVTQNSRNLKKPQNIKISSDSFDQISMPNEQLSQQSNNIEDLKATDKEKCNIFDGKWVYNPQPSPPYTESQCPFVNSQFTCQLNGRPDFGYVNWSWEATSCQIPMFNGTDMLERLRGKRVIFIGDSLNHNQYESLACLLYSALPPAQAKLASKHAHFRAEEYDFSLENYWSPFLIQLEGNQANGSRTLRLGTISDTAEKWKGADIMVFNSGHWWEHGKAIRVWNSFEHNGEVVKEMKIESAYAAALKTWAHWIDTNVDSNKTRVFFRSISPVHTAKQTCLGKSEPLQGNEYVHVQTYPKSMKDILVRTIEGMKTPVTYFNITKLSQFRADAHPGYYIRSNRRSLRVRRKHRKPKSTSEQPESGKSIPDQQKFIPEQPESIPRHKQPIQHIPEQPKSAPKKPPEFISKQPQSISKQTQIRAADCNHWCLPGVPDTWNRLLYASIVLESSGDNSKAS